KFSCLKRFTPALPQNIFKSCMPIKDMNKWIELLVGLVLVILPIYSWIANPWEWGLGTAAFEFFKGGLVWFVIMVGLLFLLLGISDLKE
ncbi:unnamed protein product, partial [marine sediment metagenome]